MIRRSTRRNAKLLCWVVKMVISFLIKFSLSVFVLNLTGVIGVVTLTLSLVPTSVTIFLCFGVLIVLKDIEPCN